MKVLEAVATTVAAAAWFAASASAQVQVDPIVIKVRILVSIVYYRKQRLMSGNLTGVEVFLQDQWHRIVSTFRTRSSDQTLTNRPFSFIKGVAYQREQHKSLHKLTSSDLQQRTTVVTGLPH